MYETKPWNNSQDVIRLIIWPPVASHLIVEIWWTSITLKEFPLSYSQSWHNHSHNSHYSPELYPEVWFVELAHPSYATWVSTLPLTDVLTTFSFLLSLQGVLSFCFVKLMLIYYPFHNWLQLCSFHFLVPSPFCYIYFWKISIHRSLCLV